MLIRICLNGVISESALKRQLQLLNLSKIEVDWNCNSSDPLRILKNYLESNIRSAGRNRLSAEPWLGVDNRLGRLNMWGGAAWLSGLVATLALLPE